MIFELKLETKFARLIFSLLALAACVLLLKTIIASFVVATLADRRYAVTGEMLVSAVEYFSDSAQLNARLAEIEATGGASDLERAETHIAQAINQSPANFRHRLLLGEIRELRGDQTGAVAAYEAALKLAPNYSEGHWRYANALLRADRQEPALEHFRLATLANKQYLSTTLDLVWNVSGKDVEAVKRIAGDDAAAQIRLAKLLAEEADYEQAIEIFSKINRRPEINSPESAAFFDLLIKKGLPGAAYELWLEIMPSGLAEHGGGGGEEAANAAQHLIWNPGFEIEPAKSAPQQFNWHLKNSDYARVGLGQGAATARTGRRALFVEFAGRDTTRLREEVRLKIILQPGANYQLSFYGRAENLQSSEGLSLAVSDTRGMLIASSKPVASDAREWRKFSFDFVAPKVAGGDGSPVTLHVYRQPRYAYDAPISGRVWLDDFSITKTSRGKADG